jgi:hypothetical protein
MDCTTRHPSRLDDTDFDLEQDDVSSNGLTINEPQSGDYFIAVIQFSDIVGKVIDDLYRPNTTVSEDLLSRTEELDAELLDWRSQLPRWLRFDRGHTFENLPLLKRQRNMLEMKFHHLRALIHRPYLCLPWLTRNDRNIKSLLETQIHRVVFSEKICVEEAQATTHMLHNVSDKKGLIEDFPWWQSISCLVCASSILLVMRAFSSPTTISNNLEALEEDADTCLKVFDALSTNSDAARQARDMLRDLRQTKVQDMSLLTTINPVPNDSYSKTATTGPPIHRVPTPSTAPCIDADAGLVSHDVWMLSSNETWPGSGRNLLDWPSEIADSMTWSSQFFDTFDPSAL